MSVVHLNFDTETLGLYERSVVTTLACCAFTLEDNVSYDELVASGFFTKFKVDEQIKVYHRETTASTIQFWKEQSEEARRRSILPSENDV